MKILFYINSIHEGGAERVITNLANQLSLRGYSVILATSIKDEWEYDVFPQVRRIVLINDKINNKLARNFKLIRNLRKILKKEKPSVSVSFMGEPNVRLIIASLGLKLKTLISVRNDPIIEYPGLLGKISRRFILPKASGCVFQTEDAKNIFCSKLKKKSRIILNPVKNEFFTFDYKQDIERSNIVTCGRLVSQKNHLLLIKAFYEIKDEISDNLLIYGNGELRERLIEEIDKLGLKDRIFLMGQTNDVLNAISRAKLFVLSSDYEGMPNALMEAFTLGVPCISTDCPCGGPKSIIKDGINGFLTPVNNTSELAKVMKTVLQNKELRLSVSQQCRKDAFDLFESNSIISLWEDYIKFVFNYRRKK